MNTEDETALYEFSRAGNLKEIKYYLHDVKVDPNKAQGKAKTIHGIRIAIRRLIHSQCALRSSFSPQPTTFI